MSDKSNSPNKSVSSPVENKNSPLREERKYAILMETNGEECESWYYFIRYNGNEKPLAHLNKQLESVEWHVLGDLSTFDLETEFLVSETTAKEMTKVDLNHTSHHRKFDGDLQMIDLKFKKRDNNDKKMTRAFDALGYGQIEDYIDGEDIDPEDLVTDDSSGASSFSEEDSDDQSESEEEKEVVAKKKKGIPPALLASTMPRIARAKQHRRKKNHL